MTLSNNKSFKSIFEQLLLLVINNASGILLLLLICIIFVAVVNVNLPGQKILWEEAQNAGHAIAFGAIALISLFFIRSRLNLGKHSYLFHYFISLVFSILLGLSTEILQYFIGRDAEVIDFVRDSLGAISFLGMYVTFDGQAKYLKILSRKTTRNIVRISSLTILGVALYSLALCCTAYILRDLQFPQIFKYSPIRVHQFVKTQDAILDKAALPQECILDDNSYPYIIASLRLKESVYPGLTIEEPYPDWSGYNYLCLNVCSPIKDTIHLSLRIDDIHFNYGEGDHFVKSLPIISGQNHFRIPLDEIKNAPSKRETDMKAIHRIILYAYNLQHPITIYLGRIWLE